MCSIVIIFIKDIIFNILDKLMTTIQKKLIFTLALALSVTTLSVLGQSQIFAQETDEKQFTKASNIDIHTVFSFSDGVEESNSFQAYNQMSGFNKNIESPTFKLQGVVDFDRPILYEATDIIYQRGITNTQHNYGQFDVDIYLKKDGITLRHFHYTSCTVADYKVSTLFDKEEGWNTSKGFATIDEFEFKCIGYSPNNPLYDLMKTTYKAETQSSLDLRDTQGWSELYK